jgi:hypothetical protein
MKVKNCPFCGSDPEVFEDSARCSDADCANVFISLERWSSRVQDSELRERVRKAEEEMNNAAWDRHIKKAIWNEGYAEGLKESDRLRRELIEREILDEYRKEEVVTLELDNDQLRRELAEANRRLEEWVMCPISILSRPECVEKEYGPVPAGWEEGMGKDE